MAITECPEPEIVIKLEYLQKLPLYEKEKPFRVYYEIPDSATDRRKTNLEFEAKELIIEDIRLKSLNFTLDDHAFAIRKLNTTLHSDAFTNKSIVEKSFLPEVERLIKSEIPGASVYFFDWRVSQVIFLLLAHNVTDCLLATIGRNSRRSGGFE
jgi:hypothetical protein